MDNYHPNLDGPAEPVGLHMSDENFFDGLKLNEIEVRMTFAFIQGAKYWEYKKTGATMWQSDQHETMEEAFRRVKAGTLGKIES